MLNTKRSQARQYALQAVYQWQMTGQSVELVKSQFLDNEELDWSQADIELFIALLQGVVAQLTNIDAALVPLIDRALEKVDPVERAALRIGAYELMYHSHISYRVIINEAVELAKIFGAEQGHRYVNGVLDKLARNVRSQEIVAKSSAKPSSTATIAYKKKKNVPDPT